MKKKPENKIQKITEELEIVRRRNKGILRAEEVVSFAQNPKTALHNQFEWDDTNAAKEYRLWQARRIIKVIVVMLPHTDREYFAYVSLKADRALVGGGYRQIVEVLGDAELRGQLLQEALEELETFQVKYDLLQKELDVVFAAIKTVKGGVHKKKHEG